MSIMKDEMRRVLGVQSHAHQVLHRRRAAHHLPWIEHIDHRLLRKEIELPGRDRNVVRRRMAASCSRMSA